MLAVFLLLHRVIILPSQTRHRFNKRRKEKINYNTRPSSASLFSLAANVSLFSGNNSNTQRDETQKKERG